MNSKTKELVCIAASVAGHCKKCFAYHYNEAEKSGVSKKDINETIEYAKRIRLAGGNGMDEFVDGRMKTKTSINEDEELKK
jgi:AhpD family alkylhydroperoxidase